MNSSKRAQQMLLLARNYDKKKITEMSPHALRFLVKTIIRNQSSDTTLRFLCRKMSRLSTTKSPQKQDSLATLRLLRMKMKRLSTN